MGSWLRATACTILANLSAFLLLAYKQHRIQVKILSFQWNLGICQTFSGQVTNWLCFCIPQSSRQHDASEVCSPGTDYQTSLYRETSITKASSQLGYKIHPFLHSNNPSPTTRRPSSYRISVVSTTGYYLSICLPHDHVLHSERWLFGPPALPCAPGLQPCKCSCQAAYLANVLLKGIHSSP